MLKRWRQERRKQNFIQKVAAINAETEQLKAVGILQIIAEDVRAGNIWPRDTLLKGYEEMDDDGLHGLISSQRHAKWILLRNPSPDAEAVEAEIDRRMRIAVQVLSSRQR